MPQSGRFTAGPTAACASACSKSWRSCSVPAAAAVQVVDIEGQPELERRYGTRIPVLTADGEFVCAYRLDTDRVRAYL